MNWCANQLADKRDLLLRVLSVSREAQISSMADVRAVRCILDWELSWTGGPQH